MTATAADRDVEAATPSRNRSSHLGLVFDPAGVSQAVIDHKYSGDGTEESPYIVDFLPEDDHNPYQFSSAKKWFITLMVAFATLAVAFVSTAYTGGIEEVIITFHVSTEVAILGISLFVCGFAVGPLLWAPMSEFYGRQVLLFGTYMALTAFNAGAAGAQNIQTLIVLRFFAGAFGSSPLTNSGGVIADMFNQKERGRATAVFAAAPFLGPSIGPIVGGFVGQQVGFRWVEGVMAIFTGVLWIGCALLVPETYAPVLLRKRAAKLSKLTGKKYVSKMDAANKKKMTTQFRIALSRPWVLLFREPIVFMTAIYMAIIYGTFSFLHLRPLFFSFNEPT
jgi:multidrug resistance protein